LGSKCHSEDAARSWRAKTIITMFFTAKKLIVLDVPPISSTFNQPYFINNIFPDLKTANLNFRRQKTGSTLWVHMDNSMCHNWSKVMSKMKKSHISRMPYPPYSPDISPCDFWLSGMSTQILRDREFSSSDETEDMIT
jgi:histone-lysine N-methyltransferase SETMAR